MTSDVICAAGPVHSGLPGLARSATMLPYAVPSVGMLPGRAVKLNWGLPYKRARHTLKMTQGKAACAQSLVTPRRACS